MTRTKAGWSLRRGLEERHGRYLNKGKVQVGKTPDSCSMALLGKGKAVKGICFVSLLHCCFL